MRRTVLISLAIGLAALSLWSAWNPGYYYLGRAALFTVMGAAACFIWIRGGNYKMTAALLYATLVLAVAIAREWLTAPPDQTESINIWYVPLFVALLVVTAIVASVTRHKDRA